MAYIAEGEIFLTGRRKDIIIRAGRNIYPHELEEAIGNLDGVRKGCVAVFGSPDPRSGTERLVALAETRHTDPAARAEVTRAIEALAVDLIDNPLDDVMLVPPLTVPKTSSGKIRRAASRESYEGGPGAVRTRAVWLQVLRLWLAGLWPQLRRWRRVSADHLYGWYAWLLGAALLVPMWLVVALIPRPALAWKAVRAFSRLLLFGWRLPVRLQGAEHLPKGRPVVIAANHSSYLDVLILGAMLPATLHFVAKRELTGNLFSRVLLNRLGTRFVERFDKQRGVEDARQLARQGADGTPLLFFPEGTFRRHPGLLPFHMGAFQAAAELGAPVLPVVVRGTRSALRDGQWLLRRCRIHVHISPPIAPQGGGWSAAVDLRNRVRAEMLRHVGEPDLAEQPVLV